MNFKFLLLIPILFPIISRSQPLERRAKYDLSKERVLYTVGYTHLDSQYEWDYKTTVSEYLKNTMDENYRLFEKYPDYVFNFTGGRRYRLMKEYHPESFKKLKGYIDKGRWCIAGSSMEEGEVNVSSSESVMRQILYGNNYFKKEFGKTSVDYMLPDCFGFVASLPTVLHHAGLIGFSTQKLTIPNLATAIPLPFNVGVWNGPDGKGIVSVLDATDYDGDLMPRLDIDKYWNNRLDEDYKKYGISFDYRYYGCGDMGGGLRDRDVVNAEGSLHNTDSKLKVVMTSSDQMYKDITPELRNKLRVYSGDLLLVEHSAGSQTSESFMKYMNRKNEILAQSAEQSAVMANLLTGNTYPTEKINNSWELVLGSQMHDILPGTAIPSAFKLAWNDEFIAQNGFNEVLKDALSKVSAKLNTKTEGRTIEIYNPVAIGREDVCTVEMSFDKIPEHIKVFDSKGIEVPSQVISRKGNNLKFIFIAKVPSVGIGVYYARSAKFPYQGKNQSLMIEPNTMENEFYKVTINDDGDISQIWDKKERRELLKSPARLEFQKELPQKEPAWNMFWYDRKNPPFDFMNHQVTIKMVENGPVRIAFEVTRQGQNSSIKQIISLSAGTAGKRVEVTNQIDWKSTGVSLKASFPLTAENKDATYNLGVGTIRRNTNHERKFEVPSKMWFDLTDQSGKFGVTILEDCKYGSDKPDDHTLRLTLLYTPSAKLCPTWLYQSTQDWGVQNVKYGLYSHNGDWSQSETPWQAEFLNKPLSAFEAPQHPGSEKSGFSLLKISNPAVGLMAMKKAENSDYYIVRVNELTGKDQTGIILNMPGKINDAYEVNGQEEKIGAAKTVGNSLNFNLSHYTIRSFAIKINPIDQLNNKQEPVSLLYDQDVMSNDDNRTDGDMVKIYDPTDHGNVNNYPAEMIPAEIVSENIHFKMGSRADQDKNAITCKGQTISLPKGSYNKVCFLASATEDTYGDFIINGKSQTLNIAKWNGFIGQHYDRQFELDGSTVLGINEPFLKHDNIAWFASHYHFGYPSRNIPYTYCYLFKYSLELPDNGGTIILPDNNKIKIFAISVVEDKSDAIELVSPQLPEFKTN